MRGGPVPVEDRCRTYWSSHGCKKRRGHQGHHRCDHGCIWPETIEGVIYFGEDAPQPQGGQTT